MILLRFQQRINNSEEIEVISLSFKLSFSTLLNFELRVNNCKIEKKKEMEANRLSQIKKIQ